MNPHLYLTVNIDGNDLSQGDVSGVTIHQPMGALHNFTIQLRQDAVSGLLSGKGNNYIGKTITISYGFPSHALLSIAPPKKRFTGVVTEISISRQSGQSLLVLTGHCPTVMLNDHPRTRSFTEKSLQAIVDEVLGPVAGSFPEVKVEPQQFTETIPYSVQYNESNYGYILRLAAWYGEWCFYDGETFHFGGDPTAGEVIKMDFGTQSLQSFNLRSATMPGKFKLSAYDYEVAEVNDSIAPGKVTSDASGQVAIDQANGTVYGQENASHLAISMPKTELDRIAERTEQLAQGNVTVATGSSRNPNLKLGSLIDVEDAGIFENYGTFVITSISHSISANGDYGNSFEATSAASKAPINSREMHFPQADNQLARVTNVADDGGLGRVKVKLPWQEGTAEETPWLRVCTPYMGGDKGFYVIPEVGDQVVVAFESSHPDYPYILTGMYHGQAKPQWFDSGNRYKGIHTRGNNVLKMDDDAGHIRFSAPAAMDIFAGTTINMSTGGKADSSITIDTGDGEVIITAKTITIKAAETIYVESGKVVEVISNETFDMSSGQTMTASAVDSLDLNTKALTASGSTEANLTSSKVNVKGSGEVTIGGGKVDINM